jgi:flagellin
MKINHNLSAIIANNQLLKSENRLSESVKRLSSGYKINEAADDPAGMAISQKMRTQIRGLSRASDNAMDGISVIETAEGALGEVHSILQRARELSVQAANDSYSLEDRENIQSEIDSLLEEVDRISRDTEFNKTSLLDGSLDQRGYTDREAVKVSTYSTSVSTGQYELTVTAAAEKAEIQAGAPAAITADTKGSFLINGEGVALEEGDTADDVYTKIRDLGSQLGVDVNLVGGKMVFTSRETGSRTDISIGTNSDALTAALGITDTEAKGKDTQMTLGSGFEKTATYTADGDYVTITDLNGFSISIRTEGSEITVPLKTTIDILDVGNLVLQVGANEGQTMEVKIPCVDTDSLHLTNLNVCSSKGAGEAISRIDDAITMVSNVRGQLGAYQNRLEHAVTNLDSTEENLTSALSRIEDVDMAEEMTEYTQSSVLQQAGVSVLAQANDLPETVLQLLS